MRSTRRATIARWGGGLLLALAPLPWLGVGAASATGGGDYATVDGHAPFSAAANKPSYWCSYGEKLDSPGGSSYTLTDSHPKVVVKAGSGEFANTIFLDVTAGEIVWADTNGDGVYNPGGPDGDKDISHIILCPSYPTQSPSETPTTGYPTDTPSETPTTGYPTDTPSETPTTPSETPTTPSETPTTPSETPTTPSVSPSESGSSSQPGTSSAPGSPSEDTSVLPTRSEHGGPLPQTGSELPVSAALAASVILIGLGALLLAGPGRLVAERYHRRH